MKFIPKVLRVLTVSWIALAVMASGVSKMVVCFGTEGHQTLKLAPQGCCQDAEGDAARGPRGGLGHATRTTADCSSCCVDVPLSPDTTVHPLSAANHTRSIVDALARMYAFSSSDDDTGWIANVSALCAQRLVPVRISPFLLTLRKVVLRI